MPEIQRPTIAHPGRRSGSGFWNQDDSSSDAAAMATVSHGPYAEQIPVASMTVGQVRQRYGDRFDIGPDSEPYLNGEPAGEDTRIEPGQVLMFARRAGEKGCTSHGSTSHSSTQGEGR
jgi:hypothetical protein